MATSPQDATLTGDDHILPFQVGDSAVRGRVVRLGGSIDKILKAHDFELSVSELLGEAAALTAAMGAALKFDGKLIFQMQGDGPAPMIVCDYIAGGGLRAMASVRDPIGDEARGIKDLIGDGRLMMTIDQGADMERYQGVTPIEGDTLEEVAVSYFNRSEQIPTAVRLAVGRVARGAGEADEWRAGAILAQFIPSEGGTRERGEAILKSYEDEEAWERAAILLETTQADELIDPSVSPEQLLFRLFHEDGVRVFDPTPVYASCQCTVEKIEAVLSRYSANELKDMLEDGAIRVTCEFCRKTFLFNGEGRALEATT